MTDQFLGFLVQMKRYCSNWNTPYKSLIVTAGEFQKCNEDTLEERSAIKLCFKPGKNAMRWQLDLLLWPRDQETEFPLETCWLSQTQEGQTEQTHPQTFDDPFFLTALAWSTCTGFPLDRQSTRNTMLRF